MRLNSASMAVHAKLWLLLLIGKFVRSRAVSYFYGLEASLEAAADLCQGDVQDSRDTDLASRLQAQAQGRVLSCPTSEGAFVDATAALWVSGYASDADVKPALVLQPVGAFHIVYLAYVPVKRACNSSFGVAQCLTTAGLDLQIQPTFQLQYFLHNRRTSLWRSKVAATLW